MSRLIKLIFLTILMMSPGMSAHAQDIPLTRTYVSPSMVFTFQYPDTWSLEELDIAVMLVPENDVTILLTSESLLSAPVDDPTGAVLMEFTQILTDQPYTAGDVKRTIINGHAAAFLDLYEEGFQTSVTTIQLTRNVVAIMVVLGEVENIREIASALQAIMESIEIPSPSSVGAPPEDIEPLTRVYDDPDSWVSFTYEADWRVQKIGDNVELVTPDGVAVSIARQPLDNPEQYGQNKPSTFIMSLIDPIQIRSGNVFMGSIRSFEANGLPAASLDIIDNQTLVRLLVLDMSRDAPVLVALTISGRVEDVQGLGTVLADLIESLEINSGDADPQVMSLPNLTGRYASEDTGLSFAYPEGWVLFDGSPLLITNNEAIVRWREPNDLQSGEIVIAIHPTIEDMVAQGLVGENPSLSEVAMALSGSDFIGQDAIISGRPAAIATNSDGIMDHQVLAIGMENGEIVVISVSTLAGEIERFRNIVMAIALTLTVVP